MLIPILCFTCGMPLGDKAGFFEKLKKEDLLKKKDMNNPNMNINHIFKQLDIEKDCCKMHMVTSTLIIEYY
jgi:DNA-directed RNA polymerase subunit N (RpoN/RPB10)